MCARSVFAVTAIAEANRDSWRIPGKHPTKVGKEAGMYRRNSKPDLLFVVTVFVCLGVLLTATVNAAEKGRWGINLSSESGCGQAIGEWQGCSQWLADTIMTSEPAPYRAALRLSTEESPDLGVVWYYTHARSSRNTERDYGLSGVALRDQTPERRQFGVVVKQQYRHFGMSLGIEAERPAALTNEPLLYFGLSNRW
jgi:hypothetical protein